MARQFIPKIITHVSCTGCGKILYQLGQTAVVAAESLEVTSSEARLELKTDSIYHSRAECDGPDNFGITFVAHERDDVVAGQVVTDPHAITTGAST